MATDGDGKKKAGPVLPPDLASQLDDEEFYRLYKEGAIQRREGALTEENWEKEIEEIPLFMTKNPTPEQVARNPDLQAIQQIIAEESTPESRALYCKDHGNQALQRAKKIENKPLRVSKMHEALKLYDEGLEEKCEDKELNSILYSNKAAINLILGNSRKVINDCEKAVELNPKNAKAYYRACIASIKIEKYKEAIDWADQGLLVNPTNKSLVDERMKAKKLKAAIEKKERQKAMQARKAAAKETALEKAIKSRGLRLLSTAEGAHNAHDDAMDAKVYLDDQQYLHWPVTLLYPEHQQTDFIRDFCEHHAFEDHFNIMFSGKDFIPWDTDKKYIHTNLTVYFETQKDHLGKIRLINIPNSATLAEALHNKKYHVTDLHPSFFVLVKGSAFEKKFLEGYD
eukprot:m.30236 g.30236  ORF g.30236 m.30236 type:complete len:399 (+) comp8186_c0_seq1:209-1405(+)